MSSQNSNDGELYFLDRRTPPKLAQIKMVTTIRANYFSGPFPKEKLHDDGELGFPIFSIDLGHLFWRQKLDLDRLRQIVGKSDVDLRQEARALDLQALLDARRALDIFGSVPARMPDADELLFAYRVIQRMIEIANRGEVGIEIHQARGFLAKDMDFFDLGEVIEHAKAPLSCALGQQLQSLLDLSILPDSLEVVLINLRNDAEIAQAVLLASLLKARKPDLRIILEAAGGNEQFDFGALVKPFRHQDKDLGRFIDYYLPKQDYRSTLRPLLNILLSGKSPENKGTANLLVLAGSDSEEIPVSVENTRSSFLRHIRNSAPFYSAGRKTLLARLTPARCHWSACYFCTINSQHLMPGGTFEFDDETDGYVDHLLDVLREREIGSLILTDEAIHPKVLEGFADRVIASGLDLVYRARSRFTDDLTTGLCKKLYASGCRYLGMGLESATPRINAMVNKHRGDAPEYRAILHNLEEAGVRPHIYSIMGFPTETIEEIEATRDFLLDAIERHDYVTVSANTFYLMRGSMIAAQPKRFGIASTTASGDLRLVLDFDEPGRAERYQAARRAAGEVYRSQFLPFGKDCDFAEGFWHFIDQAGIFYVQKVERRSNPYRALERNFAELPPRILERFTEKLPRHWIFELPGERDGEALICDWVTLNYARLPRSWADIALRASDEPISEAVGALPAAFQADARSCFVALYKAGFFSASNIGNSATMKMADSVHA